MLLWMLWEKKDLIYVQSRDMYQCVTWPFKDFFTRSVMRCKNVVLQQLWVSMCTVECSYFSYDILSDITDKDSKEWQENSGLLEIECRCRHIGQGCPIFLTILPCCGISLRESGLAAGYAGYAGIKHCTVVRHEVQYYLLKNGARVSNYLKCLLSDMATTALISDVFYFLLLSFISL